MADRAQALDLRRQEQIRRQKESMDRVLARLQTVHTIVYDDEQWAYDNVELVRGSLKEALGEG